MAAAQVFEMPWIRDVRLPPKRVPNVGGQETPPPRRPAIAIASQEPKRKVYVVVGLESTYTQENCWVLGVYDTRESARDAVDRGVKLRYKHVNVYVFGVDVHIHEVGIGEFRMPPFCKDGS